MKSDEILDYESTEKPVRFLSPLLFIICGILILTGWVFLRLHWVGHGAIIIPTAVIVGHIISAIITRRPKVNHVILIILLTCIWFYYLFFYLNFNQEALVRLIVVAVIAFLFDWLIFRGKQKAKRGSEIS